MTFPAFLRRVYATAWRHKIACSLLILWALAGPGWLLLYSGAWGAMLSWLIAAGVMIPMLVSAIDAAARDDVIHELRQGSTNAPTSLPARNAMADALRRANRLN